MPTFSAYDGTRLSYRTIGDGDPLVCLPGGPMQDSAYLGDLGGLPENHRLSILDLRGTGRSAVPDDTSSYRCDRQVDDVEALREHLGLDRMALLGHSAGANLATLYAARYPERVGRLALIGPSGAVVGLTVTGEMRRETARLRKDEPWFPAAFAALERLTTGAGTEEDGNTINPFWYGRWDATAQRHLALQAQGRNDEAAGIFGSDGAYSPEATRATLATFAAPVLLLVGECDVNSPPGVVAEFAGLFPAATLVVQPGASHSPWLDDADLFASTVTAFLRQPAA